MMRYMPGLPGFLEGHLGCRALQWMQDSGHNLHAGLKAGAQPAARALLGCSLDSMLSSPTLWLHSMRLHWLRLFNHAGRLLSSLCWTHQCPTQNAL